LAQIKLLTTSPPRTRKRKAALQSQDTSSSQEPPSKKVDIKRTAPLAQATLPATPVTTTSMDSEEDFNSAQSSDDFLDQDSDVSEQAGIFGNHTYDG